MPHAHIALIVTSEVAESSAWAQRHGYALDWRPETLTLRTTLTQPQTGERFYLQGIFADYRALPPLWDFMDADWQAGGKLANFPKMEGSPFGGSLFINHQDHGVICAPFSRLAYQAHDGPHVDWGVPADWLTAGGSHVRAVHLGDMLQAIRRDFVGSKGRLA